MEGSDRARKTEALKRRYWLERGGGVALFFLALLLYVSVVDARLPQLYLGLGAGLVAMIWAVLDNWITELYRRRKRAAKLEANTADVPTS